ncbi:hypothetical protein AB0M44_43045 [Streptosporangium subroseum]|uniref:hypothetical protein n=1 Tax=Streptosporangium subroseum TaxID=106412 RepID=UPI003414183B
MTPPFAVNFPLSGALITVTDIPFRTQLPLRPLLTVCHPVGQVTCTIRGRTPDEIEELPMHDTQRLRIAHFRQGTSTPYIG